MSREGCCGRYGGTRTARPYRKERKPQLNGPSMNKKDHGLAVDSRGIALITTTILPS